MISSTFLHSFKNTLFYLVDNNRALTTEAVHTYFRQSCFGFNLKKIVSIEKLFSTDKF